MKRYALAVFVSVLVMISGSAALAHTSSGKAQPKIEVSGVQPQTTVREYTVRLSDADGSGPIGDAEVILKAAASRPLQMTIGPVRLAPAGTSGAYKARVKFPMWGKWQVTINVGGSGIADTNASFTENLEEGMAAPEAQSRFLKPKKAGHIQASLKEEIPWLGVLIMAIHIVFATIWIGGYAVITLALWPALRNVPGLYRGSLFGAVLKRFSTLTALSVILVVATGVYNALFGLPTSIVKLQASALGTLYLGLLITKIGLVTVAILIGVYASAVVVPRIGHSDGGDESNRFEKRMFVLTSINLTISLLILALAAALGRLHMLLHGI